MLQFLRTVPMWAKIVGGSAIGLVAYDKLIAHKPVFPPGFLGKLSPKLAPKVANAINTSQNPTVLRQLADGLSKAGAPVAASLAHAKADVIESTQAPFSRTITELTQPASAPVATTATAPNLAQVAAQVAAATGVAPVIPATVKIGSRGAEVLELQSLLGITADGIFGPQTQLALKSYQQSHGLTADGIAGPKTWTALLSGQ